MQKITLIRHAKTKDNLEKRFSGKIESEVAVSKEDIRQIVLPKISVQEMGKVYSSPSKRAIFTAQAFTEDFSIEEDIREIDFGLFEGMTLEEITSAYPEELEKWINLGFDYRFPEGDSINTFYKRASGGLEKIINRTSPDENITIFTHGGVIQSLISFLLVKDNSFFWNFKIDNCSLTQFTIQDGTVVFEKINY